MTDPLPSLDLRLTPDWLKESEPANRYADYEGDSQQDRHQRGRRDRRDERPRRPMPRVTAIVGNNPIGGPSQTPVRCRALSSAFPKVSGPRPHGTIGRDSNGAKTRPPAPKSNRLLSRSTSFRRNALFQRSSSRSSKVTWPIHCSGLPGCF